MPMDMILKYPGLHAGFCLIRSSFKGVDVIYKTISRKYSHNLHFFRSLQISKCFHSSYFFCKKQP